MLISIIALAACGKPAPSSAPTTAPVTSDAPAVTAAAPEPTGKTITVGILPAEGAIPIILAKEQGFFAEAGINVDIKAFTSPADRNVAVQAKELDATIADVMTAAAFQQNGISMKITSDINEDFKLVAAPDSGITDVAGLSGKQVSLVPNFILEYIMDQFAAKHNFTYEIVEIPSFAARGEALLANQVDAVVFTEPQASMMVQMGAHLLGDSKSEGIKGGTLLFAEQLLQNQAGDVHAFYQAYDKAIDYMNQTDPAAYSEILASYQFPEQIGAYLSSLQGKFTAAAPISVEQFDSIIAWSKDKGLIEQQYAYEDLVDFQHLQTN